MELVIILQQHEGNRWHAVLCERNMITMIWRLTFHSTQKWLLIQKLMKICWNM